MDTVTGPAQAAHCYSYSNSNYILLAALVERLTGMSLADYARQVLFAPLGIHRLTFDDDRFNVIEQRVTSYEQDAARPFGYKQHLGNANTVGDGGMYGSIADLLQWEMAWHRQWSDSASVLHAMLQASPFLDGTVHDYRFGLEITQRSGQDVVFHSGALWGFRSLIVRLPQTRTSIIHLANCEEAEPDMEQLIAAALAWQDNSPPA